MPVKDTNAMIAGMEPVLQPDRWVYCFTQNPADLSDAFAVIREREGMTLILPLETATDCGFDTSVVMRQITLSVFSDLEGVGLTAAVAAALTAESISCNVVAAYHHDHVFVPEADADRAMTALQAAQRAASV